jgi:hypothetical protein
MEHARTDETSVRAAASVVMLEAIESIWLTPRLQQYRDGRIDLAPPQIMSLAHLSRHASVAAALSQARLRPPPVVMPEPFEHEGARMVCLSR